MDPWEKKPMTFTEKRVEEFIFNNHYSTLRSNGLHAATGADDFMLRQFGLGRYGIADLISISYYTDKDIHYIDATIYEIKRDGITLDAYLQATRYQAGLKHFLLSIFGEIKTSFRFKKVLIGSEVKDENVLYLSITSDEYPDLELYTYTINSDDSICFSGYADNMAHVPVKSLEIHKFPRKSLERISNLLSEIVNAYNL